MNIVLFGGSFNPPHLGHQIVLTQAFELIPDVDEIWLVPDYYHTFTKETDYAPAKNRLAMCELLLSPHNKSNNPGKFAFARSKSRPGLRIPLKPQKRSGGKAPESTFANDMSSPPALTDRATQGPSLDTFLGKQESIDTSSGTQENKSPSVRVETYNLDNKTSGDSIITVQALKKQYPKHHFSFLIGSDNLQSFTKWGSWQKLLEELPFFVYPRAGYPFEPLYKNMTPLKSPLQVVTNISSTLIRNRLKKHLTIHHLVPTHIESYISKNKLYL